MDTAKILDSVENLMSTYIDELPKDLKIMLKAAHENFSIFRKNEPDLIAPCSIKYFIKNCSTSSLEDVRSTALEFGWDVTSCYSKEDFSIFLCVFTPEKDRILFKP